MTLREDEAAERFEIEVDAVIASMARGALEGGPKVRGVCGVCGGPVTEEDDPVTIEWANGRPGVLHGSYDCLDQPRCSVVGFVAVGVSTREARCVLRENHPRDHLI